MGGKKSAENVTTEMVLAEFKGLDSDDNGVLDKEEFTSWLIALDSTKWTKAKAEKLFATIDSNGDGELQYEEFVDWICGGKTILAKKEKDANKASSKQNRTMEVDDHSKD